MSRRKKDSVSSITEEIIRAETRRLGRPVLFREINAVWDGRPNRPSDKYITNALGHLRRTGRIEKHGDPGDLQTYSHVADPVEPTVDSDKPHVSRYRKDSIPTLAAALLLNETKRLHAPITLRQLAAAWETEFGAPAPRGLSNALIALSKREVALKVDGVIGEQTYRHADYEPPARISTDDAIVEAVASLAKTGTGGATAAEVLNYLKSAGYADLGSDQLRNRMETLARDTERKRRRGHGSHAGARLRKITSTSSGGRQVVIWLPPGARRRRPKSETLADGLRAAIATAENELGRPVSRRELVLWASSARRTGTRGLRNAAESVLARGLGVRLTSLATKGSLRGQRVRRIRTSFASRKTFPTRYSVQPAGPGDHCTVVEDLAILLRPSLELEGIDDLKSTPLLTGSMVERIAEAREELLGGLITAHCAGFDLFEVTRNWHRAAAVQIEWAHAAGNPLHPLVLELRGKEVEVRALAACRGAACADLDGVESILNRPGTPVEIVESWVEEMNQILDRQAIHPRAVLERVRRVRSGSMTHVTRHPQRTVFADRADALVVLVRGCGLPAIGAAVDAAHLVLGGVLRDPRVVEQWLGMCRPGDVFLRRALTAACGLLGAVPTVEVAWPDPRSADEAESYLMAVALGCDCQEERTTLVHAADRRARGPAAAVTADAAIRVQFGNRLGLVDG